MIKTNYANAYKEVLVIINNLTMSDYNKIPKEYIDFLTDNCNNEYEFEYDNTKSFKEQELLKETKYILFGLFEKFGATEIQKEKINIFKNNFYNKLEIEKKEKYNPDDIFKKMNKKESNSVKMLEKNCNISLKKCKESFFQKFKNFISKILHM